MIIENALKDAFNEFFTIYRNNNLGNQPPPRVNIRRATCHGFFDLFTGCFYDRREIVDLERIEWAFNELYQDVFELFWEDLYDYAGTTRRQEDVFSAIVMKVTPNSRGNCASEKYKRMTLTLTTLQGGI